MFHTAIVVHDASSHPSHLWNLKNIILAVCWLDNMLVCPHLHHAAPHTLHSSVKYSFVQNRLKSAEKEGKSRTVLFCYYHVSHLKISRGVSTYLIPVSRTPDIHCHTSSLQSSGMELAWLDLTVSVILLNILVLLSSLSWDSSNNSSTILVIQLGLYVRAKLSTIKIQDT